MKQFRITFTDNNALDPQDRTTIQRDIINADNEEIAREIFASTNCDIISVEEVATLESINTTSAPLNLRFQTFDQLDWSRYEEDGCGNDPQLVTELRGGL